jgi:hypothetical protein
LAVIVCLPLFGDPAHELDENATGRNLRDLGESLRERLAVAADSLEKLHASGWTSRIVTFDALLSRADVQTREDAERLIRAAGVDPAGLMIVEEIDEEDV